MTTLITIGHTIFTCPSVADSANAISLLSDLQYFVVIESGLPIMNFAFLSPVSLF